MSLSENPSLMMPYSKSLNGKGDVKYGVILFGSDIDTFEFVAKPISPDASHDHRNLTGYDSLHRYISNMINHFHWKKRKELKHQRHMENPGERSNGRVRTRANKLLRKATTA